MNKSGVKSLDSIKELHLKLFVSSTIGEGGIPSVEVKFIDIGRNTSGEGDPLDRY
jgi:hypothetical protein